MKQTAMPYSLELNGALMTRNAEEFRFYTEKVALEVFEREMNNDVKGYLALKKNGKVIRDWHSDDTPDTNPSTSSAKFRLVILYAGGAEGQRPFETESAAEQYVLTLPEDATCELYELHPEVRLVSVLRPVEDEEEGDCFDDARFQDHDDR